MLDWKKHKLEKIAGKNINNLRYADDTTHMAESEEELKNLLIKVTCFFLMLSFKPALSHSTFIFIQRLVSSSSLSASRMVSSAHLRLSIFLLAIFIPACDSSSPAFCIIHLACVFAKSLQSSPTLCNLVDCSLPGSSVHGILQARILSL